MKIKLQIKPIIAILGVVFLSFFFTNSLVAQDKTLNLIPPSSKLNSNPEGGALSIKSKDLLNKIYRNQQQKVQKRKAKINRATKTQVDLSGYETQKGNQELGFDIAVKKPGRALEKKQDLYKKAYKSTINSQYEVAIILFNKILKRYRKDEYALVGLATSYHFLGDLRSAKEYYIKTLALYPNNILATNNFLVLVGQEAPEESLKELLKLDKIYYNHAIKAQISYLYAYQKEYDKALKYIDLSLSESQNNLRYLYNKAIILDHLGQKKRAAIIYNEVLNKAPENIVGISRNAIKERLQNI